MSRASEGDRPWDATVGRKSRARACRGFHPRRGARSRRLFFNAANNSAAHRQIPPVRGRGLVCRRTRLRLVPVRRNPTAPCELFESPLTRTIEAAELPAISPPLWSRCATSRCPPRALEIRDRESRHKGAQPERGDGNAQSRESDTARTASLTSACSFDQPLLKNARSLLRVPQPVLSRNKLGEGHLLQRTNCCAKRYPQIESIESRQEACGFPQRLGKRRATFGWRSQTIPSLVAVAPPRARTTAAISSLLSSYEAAS